MNVLSIGQGFSISVQGFASPLLWLSPRVAKGLGGFRHGSGLATPEQIWGGIYSINSAIPAVNNYSGNET